MDTSVVVSVPSTGRSGLQLEIKRSCTQRYFLFQYPLRVEVGCNPYVVLRVGVSEKFQYPLRVEVGCNMIAWVTSQRQKVFQYPLRVEVGCNRLVVPRHLLGWVVSVPSTGRSGLQRINSCGL